MTEVSADLPGRWVRLCRFPEVAYRSTGSVPPEGRSTARSHPWVARPKRYRTFVSAGRGVASQRCHRTGISTLTGVGGHRSEVRGV